MRPSRLLFGNIALAVWGALPTYALSQTQPTETQAPTETQTPLVTPPRLVSATMVTTSESIRQNAGVELLLIVGPDGIVVDHEVLEGINPQIDLSVVNALPNLRFEPATRDGVAIRSRVRFRYRVLYAGPLSPPVYDEMELEAESLRTAAVDVTDDVEPEDPTDSATDGPSSEYEAEAVVDRAESGAATRITLEGPELTTVPGTFGEPLRVVATLPGVARTPFGLGFFVVRGAGFQNTGFFVDGFPVPLLYHFGAGPAVLSSRLVTRLRFYPGGYPVSQGRFSAGLIALETAPPAVRSFRAELEVDLLRASALAVLPFDEGRGTVAAAFRTSYYDLILPLIVQGLSVRYLDYQLRADYRFDSSFRASLFAFGSDDALDQSGAIGGGTTTAGSNTNVSVGFQRIIGRLEWQTPNRGSLRIAGALGRDAQSFGSQTASTSPQNITTEAWSVGLRVDWIQPLESWLELNAGLDLASNVFNVSVTAPLPTGLGEYPRPVLDPNLSLLRATSARSTPGMFVEPTFRFDPLEIAVGVRFDYLRYGTVSQIAPDPRIVSRLRLTPELVVKAATGLFTQPPQAFQTLGEGGNPALGPQRAWQTSAGLELDLPLDVEVELTGFYSHMYNIAQFSQSIITGQNGQPRREFFRADGEGRAYGLEFLLRRPSEEGFYGWISYTLSRSERVDDGVWIPFSFDQTHVLNLAASYSFDGWRFGLRFQLATGRPTDVVTAVRYDADSNGYSPTFSSSEFGRLPTYHQLDARIDRDFDLGDIEGSVYIDVLNVYNAQNSEGLIYQYDYARTTSLPGLPILGTLGIRATWGGQ